MDQQGSRISIKPDVLSLTTNPPSIESILEQVDQLQNAIDSNVRCDLEEENISLEVSIECARKRLFFTGEVLREAFEAYIVLDSYIQAVKSNTTAIQEEWKSYIFS